MGIYPQVQFDRTFLKQKSVALNLEINQCFPRELKGNLIYHQITSLQAGQGSSALLTKEGKLLMQGLNNYGQQALGDEFGPEITFFPDFRTVDFFHENKL